MQTDKLVSKCSKHALLAQRSWSFFTNPIHLVCTSVIGPSLEEIYYRIHCCTVLIIITDIVWFSVFPVPAMEMQMIGYFTRYFSQSTLWFSNQMIIKKRKKCSLGELYCMTSEWMYRKLTKLCDLMLTISYKCNM